ncbi:propanediol/glycerol family dehydratase large subunit [Acetobacterium wieringae]|jgi:propanediol dehydratase large subunit|uniref:Propanediol dehydratase large subunit n=1 Tax=Acetobacterium wieringae TaxID=52694 RepID=A0A1F2PG46_9FIRM|nr:MULTISPECIES: propanediol/glycerol family dehydratase large subunit [Acetobacterium]OFV69914.1 propanediol dehydratase large subunit [Acetobacterium wieringae]TYC86038.1 propanediol/glycerol family dehydratase large subunit [Acetobacterium wieringae]URN86154.1 propanediol/glycerol family dehydratase large subunit [Acetobacterium wieringae]UYO64655.1 propanediol/glycerol family dehydratase large subunit [Acetobacterium wieringae]VUZ27405.1 Propanediol dehydratase large subunit [Acetobacteriu
MKSKRFEALAARPVKKDGFVKEWPEVGLIAMNSPQDPTPSLVVENGVVVELDGKKRADFDMLDTFIANYAIRLEKAQEYMAMDSLKIANMLVDINVPRDVVVDITTSITPAKIVEVLGHMTVLEMMMAQSKMRARLMPSNQCHVTNVKDNMVQIAADAAEAAIRGFDEMETTVGIGRYAPFNALAIMVGANVGRPGILTQCAVEEATELDLGMKGYTAYAETISVYGTEPVFMDGDDTPYSKAFLASSYASRGLKMRFTSGSGSEVQMGYAEGKSMLYLEARCLYITKGAGVQGSQNGSVSCIGVPAGVPGGIREVLAENLLAACLDLECASSNDQTFTHSDLRRVARSLMQMVPGTDYICSGYSATPNYDNMFAGSNWDADDYDDWNVIQRDLKIDAGLQPVDEDTVVAARAKGARAMQILFRELGLTEITDAEVEAATYARGSQDMPDRDVVADLKAVEDLMNRGATAVDFIKALDRGGMRDVAESIFNIQLQKCAGDYLHTASKLSSTWECISAVNYPNTYHGVKTGYVISDERWAQIQDIPWAVDPASI